MINSIKSIALYLPQYHPIPENNKWWGNGFTEWTNVAKARPLFKGHYQPRLPADLGFYDLRVPEIREQQAEMARNAGLYGFCYYHYWFGNGRQLLQRPFEEVCATKHPNFPFMLCWANQTWQGVWYGNDSPEVLVEQTYPGKADYLLHFEKLRSAFADERYIKIDEKPVFLVYMPRDIPDLNLFVDTFRECALKAGFKGIFLLATNCPKNWNPYRFGFDGVVSNNFHRVRKEASGMLVKDRYSVMGRIVRRITGGTRNIDMSKRTKPFVIRYPKFDHLISNWQNVDYNYFPQVVPNWDNSPRAGRKSLIVTESTPELWLNHMQKACDYVKRYEVDKRLIFIKSWNEWAEGNYLEPDQMWGNEYLNILSRLRE